MKRHFHNELEALRARLVLMGERAMDSVRLAMQSVTERDFALADQVLNMDDEIDDLESEIEHEAVRYITLRQPIASDLRLLMVALKASHDIERVGDEATSIAKRCRKVFASSPTLDLLNIPEMTEMATLMLGHSLDSFIREDADLALEICRRDRQVDVLNRDNYKGFLELIQLEEGDSRPILELIFV
ncbi:MAG: phosphate signaling complex protein PhoU, partial [Verrucomicrobiota bacterium]